MSDKIKGGGPAFPQGHLDGPHVDPSGLSKRELFAGMAMQGLATSQEMLLSNQELLAYFGTDGIDKLQANKAVRLADALIAELEKGQP